MAKNSYFSRYLNLYEIIKKNGPIEAEELIQKYNNSNDRKNDLKPISKRTFHRDLAEMKELFGIDIKYNKSERAYRIEKDIKDTNQKLLMDSYRYIHTYQQFEDIKKYVACETRESGLEYLTTILDAIKCCKIIHFNYKRYVSSELSRRRIEPYFVKEFKLRWYVVAKDLKDGIIKTFALDRIQSEPFAPEGSSCYDIHQDMNPQSYFADVFGIFKMRNLQAEEVILSFNPIKSKFLLSQPLHPSQVVIDENEKEIRVKLNVQLTHDFKMELLSHGSEIKVIAPEELVNDMRNELEETLKQY